MTLKTSDILTDRGEVSFLGSKITRDGHVFTMTGDEHLIQRSVDELGLTNAKEVVSPGVQYKRKDDDVAMSDEEKSFFQRQVGRLLHVSFDRPDVQFATKCVARRMTSPCVSDLEDVKRIFRSLWTRPMMTLVFGNVMSDLEAPIAYVDSDWAGDHESRRSTASMILKIGASVVATVSRTQTGVALSSAEANVTTYSHHTTDHRRS